MESIYTTINVRADLRNRIISAAVSSGISVNEIIIRLLTYARKSADLPITMFSRVRYQPRSDEHEWVSQHVRWRVDDYEKFQDLRRLWKRTVSFILAYAIEHYLDICSKEQFSSESFKNSDNNPASYFFMSKFDRENEYFVIFWKYPPPKNRNILHSSIPLSERQSLQSYKL